jgi:hypothetical protein
MNVEIGTEAARNSLSGNTYIQISLQCMKGKGIREGGKFARGEIKGNVLVRMG